MLNLYITLPLIGVLSAFLALVGKRKHALNVLLCLEFIVINLYWLIRIIFALLGTESYFLLYFLTVSACEGALGLALLVAVVRTHGNDHLSNTTLMELC